MNAKLSPRVQLPSAPGPARAPAVEIPQYSLGKILSVWLIAAAPMGVLAWVVAPRLASTFEGPWALARALVVCLTIGLVWQFVAVAIFVKREQGTLRWSTVRQALWLQRPRSPRTGRIGGRVWLILIPLILVLGAEELISDLPHAAGRDFGLFLGSNAGQSFLDGNWAFLGAIVLLGVFNTVLGEELLFRGFLLPRMNGVFGRGDWLANGVLFALYHVHVPWVIPAGLLDAFILSYPTKRYRSAWIGIAVHSAQTVVITAAVLAVVL